MDCSLPGFSVHGIFQARVLEWVGISFSRGSSRPGDRTWVSCIVDRCFTLWATREAMDMDYFISLLKKEGKEPQVLNLLAHSITHYFFFLKSSTLCISLPFISWKIELLCQFLPPVQVLSYSWWCYSSNILTSLVLALYLPLILALFYHSFL